MKTLFLLIFSSIIFITYISIKYKKESKKLSYKKNWNRELIYVHKSRIIVGFMFGCLAGFPSYMISNNNELDFVICSFLIIVGVWAVLDSYKIGRKPKKQDE